MGAPGMIAVCANCKRLECLDLGDVRGLEDATFAFFHEHPMARLSRVSLEPSFCFERLVPVEHDGKPPQGVHRVCSQLNKLPLLSD